MATTKQLTSSTITAGEWNKVFKTALNLYKTSIWNLANIIELGSNKFGRDNIISMVPFDEEKVKFFNAISRVEGKKKHLLPEVVYEIVNSSDHKKWLAKADKEQLKPSQLRKMIRDTERVFKKEKKVNGVVTYPRMLILLENELKRLPIDQRDTVNARIKQLTENRL